MRITTMNIRLDDDCSVRLVKETAKNYAGVDRLDHCRNIVRIMNDVFHMDRQAEEYLYLIAMTTKCRPIGFFEIAHGGANFCMISVREIFIRALISGASCMVLVHNHPSGEPEPSSSDISLTRKVEEASQLIGITFCDHIIIGRGRYFSFLEEGGLRQGDMGGTG